MEDAHTTLLKLDPSSENTFFAVFDGHGGVYILFPISCETDSVKAHLLPNMLASMLQSV
jgi:hypothetical protein